MEINLGPMTKVGNHGGTQIISGGCVRYEISDIPKLHPPCASPGLHYLPYKEYLICKVGFLSTLFINPVNIVWICLIPPLPSLEKDHTLSFENES